MNFQPQLSQEDLAQMIDRERLAFECRLDESMPWSDDPSTGVFELLHMGYQIRLAPGALTEFGLKPDGEPPLNPDGLTADVITEGGKYRACVKSDWSEIDYSMPESVQVWCSNKKEWTQNLKVQNFFHESITFRLPINHPFPSKEKLEEKECIEVLKSILPAWHNVVEVEINTPDDSALGELTYGDVRRIRQVLKNLEAVRVPVSTPFPKPSPATEESSSAQSDTPRIPVGRLERTERELTAAISQRDEARRLLGEAKEVLSDLSRYVSAGAYPDGPCLKDEDLNDVNITLKQITEYLK